MYAPPLFTVATRVPLRKTSALLAVMQGARSLIARVAARQLVKERKAVDLVTAGDVQRYTRDESGPR